MSRSTREFALPDKGVAFLGGHPNMLKKLKQLYPKWKYFNDDTLHRCKASLSASDVVFYWNKHCSHTIMEYSFKKLPKDTEILYVTSTNIPLLIEEMHNAYVSSRIPS